MNFDLAELRAFVAVTDLGSFRAASEALHLSQPALSRRVDKLEQALGFRLLERTTRRVELNAMGRAFLPKARHVLNELEMALLGLKEVSDRVYGKITIACVPSVLDNLVAEAIKLFREQHPGIFISVLDQTAPEILLSVSRADADFGVSYLGTQEPDLKFEPLFEEQFVLACRTDHPLAQRTSIDWAELPQYDCVALAPGSGNRLLIDQALVSQPTRPRWICEVKHVPALVSLIKAGVGIGILPNTALPQSPQSELVGILLTNPPLTRTIGITQRIGRPLHPFAQLFRGLLAQVCQRPEA